MNADERRTMRLDGRGRGGELSLWMVLQSRALGLLAVWPVLAMALLTACGDDDGGGGNEDTLLTGLSGVIIFGLVIWFVVRKAKSRG